MKCGIALFEDIKKKLNKPEILTKIFYGATILVILNRLIALLMTLGGKSVRLPSDELYRSLFWHSEEYARCLLDSWREL